MSDATAAVVAAATADIDKKIFDAKIDVLAITKRDWLENQCKQYENNIKISGLQYNIGEYYRKTSSQRREWRADVIQRALVDTKVMAEDVLFAKSANGKKELRRIVRDVHPLGNKNNATIIVAFTESWVANDVKETVRKGQGLEMTTRTTRSNKNPETIKINSHVPDIIDCLRNEGLRVRRGLIAASGGKKRYTLNESMKYPWVTLFEIDGDSRKAIPFAVEDGRLADPARTLAVYSLKGGKFKPYRLLSAAEREAEGIPVNVMTTAPAEQMAA